MITHTNSEKKLRSKTGTGIFSVNNESYFFCTLGEIFYDQKIKSILLIKKCWYHSVRTNCLSKSKVLLSPMTHQKLIILIFLLIALKNSCALGLNFYAQKHNRKFDVLPIFFRKVYPKQIINCMLKLNIIQPKSVSTLCTLGQKL